MIPKLYYWANIAAAGDAAGTLTDCVSCKITRTNKGVYECEFKYPVNGFWFKKMGLHDWIKVDAEENGTEQPFEIYRISADMGGIVTYNCRHAKYRLGFMAIMPYTAASAAEAMAGLVTNNPVSSLQNRFTFSSTISKSGEFKSIVPMTPLQLLEGGEGSITDVFGGMVDYDGFNVTLRPTLGRQTDLTIRYGKNLTDLKLVNDAGDTYNVIIPFWHKTETDPDTGADVEKLVTTVPQYSVQTDHLTDENGDRIRDDRGYQLVSQYGGLDAAVPMDMSGEFDEEPRPMDLFYKAQNILIHNHPWQPKEDIDLGFIPLWQTEEDKSMPSPGTVSLYDTVHVFYEALGITKDAQIVKTIYDALLGRYEMIGIETIRDSFADTMQDEASALAKSAANSVNERGRTVNGTVYLPTAFNLDGTAESWVAVRVKKGIIE